MIRLVLLLALLCSSTLTLAQGGTITSGPATFYRSFGLGQSVELKGVSTFPTYSQLSDFGWWYRVNGDPTQYQFPTPTLEAYPGNTSTRSWLNVNGRGFNAREVCTLVGTAAPAGGALSCTMTLINPAAVPLSINLFVAANIALPLGNPTDSATLGVANQRIDIAAANGLTRARFHGIGAAAYAVSGAFGGISNLLNNGSLTNFTNTGLPSGPISFWGGYQWKLIVAGNSSRDATSLIEIITDPVNGVCATIPPQTSVTVPAFGACVTGVGSAPLFPTLANYTWKIGRASCRERV